MKRKLIVSLLLLVMGLFFFNSCRTDETAQEEKRTEREKIGAFARFEENLASKKLLQKEGSEYVSYHEPFMNIIKTFMDKNPDYSKKFNEQVGDVYFDLRSLTYGDANKGIVYPIMKDGKVNAALFGIINLERDWVNFSVLKNDSPEVQSILAKLQKAYDAMQLSKGREQMHEEAIEEVIITVYQSIPGPSYIFYYPFLDYGSNGGSGGLGGGMSGGGAIHGGGGGTPVTPPSPCEKAKNILSKPDVQAKIKELKVQAPKGGEIGVKIKSDGTTSATIPGAAHEVDLGDTAGYLGGYHNHTPNGIKMLSPPDIIKLLNFSIAQPNGNIGDGFMGMIGSESCSTCPNGIKYYNYMINFSGTAQELSQFLYNNNWDSKKLIKEFQVLEGQMTLDLSNVDYLGADLNNQGLEKLFFETLKGMGMEGKVNLQRIEDNGIVNNIKLNSGGTGTTATPCS